MTDPSYSNNIVDAPIDPDQLKVNYWVTTFGNTEQEARQSIKQLLDDCLFAITPFTFDNAELTSFGSTANPEFECVSDGDAYVQANADVYQVNSGKPVCFDPVNGDGVCGIDPSWGVDEYKTVGIAYESLASGSAIIQIKIIPSDTIAGETEDTSCPSGLTKNTNHKISLTEDWDSGTSIDLTFGGATNLSVFNDTIEDFTNGDTVSITVYDDCSVSPNCCIHNLVPPIPIEDIDCSGHTNTHTLPNPFTDNFFDGWTNGDNLDDHASGYFTSVNPERWFINIDGTYPDGILTCNNIANNANVSLASVPTGSNFDTIYTEVDALTLASTGNGIGLFSGLFVIQFSKINSGGTLQYSVNGTATNSTELVSDGLRLGIKAKLTQINPEILATFSFLINDVVVYQEQNVPATEQFFCQPTAYLIRGTTLSSTFSRYDNFETGYE